MELIDPMNFDKPSREVDARCKQFGTSLPCYDCLYEGKGGCGFKAVHAAHGIGDAQ